MPISSIAALFFWRILLNLIFKFVQNLDRKEGCYFISPIETKHILYDGCYDVPPGRPFHKGLLSHLLGQAPPAQGCQPIRGPPQVQRATSSMDMSLSIEAQSNNWLIQGCKVLAHLLGHSINILAPIPLRVLKGHQWHKSQLNFFYYLQMHPFSLFDSCCSLLKKHPTQKFHLWVRSVCFLRSLTYHIHICRCTHIIIIKDNFYNNHILWKR